MRTLLELLFQYLHTSLGCLWMCEDLLKNSVITLKCEIQSSVKLLLKAIFTWTDEQDPAIAGDLKEQSSACQKWLMPRIWSLQVILRQLLQTNILHEDHVCSPISGEKDMEAVFFHLTLKHCPPCGFKLITHACFPQPCCLNQSFMGYEACEIQGSLFIPLSACSILFLLKWSSSEDWCAHHKNCVLFVFWRRMHTFSCVYRNIATDITLSQQSLWVYFARLAAVIQSGEGHLFSLSSFVDRQMMMSHFQVCWHS